MPDSLFCNEIFELLSEGVKPNKGIHKTDGALKKAKEMFSVSIIFLERLLQKSKIFIFLFEGIFFKHSMLPVQMFTSIRLIASDAMFQNSRGEVPRIAVVMADASNYASHSLEKLAKSIHKEGITIVGVGKK